MKKILCLFFVAVIWLSCNSPGRTKFKRIALDNSLLWEISGNGLSAPSYLFGTDHLIGGNFLDTLTYVMVKFKQCRAVVNEMKLDSPVIEYKHHIFLKKDSLSNLFTASEYAEIDKVLTHYLPWPLARYNRLKPVYVYHSLYRIISTRTASTTNPHLDQYFRAQGAKMGYKLLGLEPLQFHDSLLYDAPLNIQKNQLLYLVRHIDQFRRSSQRSFKLYHQQNLYGMEVQMNPKSEFRDIRLDHVVKDRDDIWLQELPAIMKQQPSFISVGAAHLLWDCGLINQLRLKGFTVTPVNPLTP